MERRNRAWRPRSTHKKQCCLLQAKPLCLRQAPRPEQNPLPHCVKSLSPKLQASRCRLLPHSQGLELIDLLVCRQHPTSSNEGCCRCSSVSCSSDPGTAGKSHQRSCLAGTSGSAEVVCRVLSNHRTLHEDTKRFYLCRLLLSNKQQQSRASLCKQLASNMLLLLLLRVHQAHTKPLGGAAYLKGESGTGHIQHAEQPAHI